MGFGFRVYIYIFLGLTWLTFFLKLLSYFALVKVEKPR